MQRKKFVWLSLVLLAAVVVSTILYVQHAHESSVPTKPGGTSVSQTSNNGTVPDRIQTIAPTTPGVPALSSIDQVTGQAATAQDDVAVPNSWGTHKDRLIRTSGGDLFTVYISNGANATNRAWHLMHQAPGSNTWVEVDRGNAGTEPINILLGPNNAIHLFTWPGTDGNLLHLESTNLGRSFTSETIAGHWESAQGYASAGINQQGDITVLQTGHDQPGIFRIAYYSHESRRWSYHEYSLNLRYTYAYLFPGYNNDLTIVAMRDVLRSELNYPSSSGFDYIFNQIGYFYIPNLAKSDMRPPVKVIEIRPQANEDTDITYLTDAYMDTQGRTHVLYNNFYEGVTHHAIIDNGKVIKDVRLDNVDSIRKARITQDATGHFYIIATSSDGNTINVYPGTAQDTDGTQLQDPVKLNISAHASCNDYDLCHSPTFTVPRSGNALSNVIDGVYGNNNAEIHFRINLRSSQ